MAEVKANIEHTEYSPALNLQFHRFDAYIIHSAGFLSYDKLVQGRAQWG